MLGGCLTEEGDKGRDGMKMVAKELSIDDACMCLCVCVKVSETKHAASEWEEREEVEE